MAIAKEAPRDARPRQASPRLRPALRAINGIGGVLRRCGLYPLSLSEDAILSAAMRKAGAHGIGNERFLPAMRALLAGYENDRALTFLGRAIAQRNVINLVATRLKINRCLEQNPSILDEKIERPIVIVGLPRTGTTLLQNLMALMPGSRPLLFWESLQPLPPPELATRETDPRIKKAERGVGVLYRMVPQLPAIHAMTPRGPDEDLGLLLSTFVCPFFRGRVPEYRDYLDQISDDEVKSAYLEHRVQLQLLQWHVPGSPWILKCPAHMFGLDGLLSAIPDACIVQMHRDPLKAVPSLCSLSAAMDTLSYSVIDYEDIGRRSMRILGQLVDRSLQTRKTADAARFCDVQYKDLVRDPIATVKNILGYFGFPVQPEHEAKMAAYQSANPRHKHGVHHYSLEEFFLDRAEVAARFAEYTDLFRPPPESAD